MKVLLRADASNSQGTGHVMRCLTLSEGLRRRGHEVILVTNHSGVSWLESEIRSSGLTTFYAPQHSLDSEAIDEHRADVVVIDSYEFQADRVPALRNHSLVMAIVDGSIRGIEADLYLDHNLGAEHNQWPSHVEPKMLAGSQYALIRDAIIEKRRDAPWQIQDEAPKVLAFMGGSDPGGTIVEVSRAFIHNGARLEVTLIVGQSWLGEVTEMFADMPSVTVIEPTTELPSLLADANVVVAAAGSSAWELCTLGIPSLLIATADNQLQSFERLTADGLVLGLNLLRAEHGEVVREVENGVNALTASEQLRHELSLRCTAVFDGEGKQRVVLAMEDLVTRMKRGC